MAKRKAMTETETLELLNSGRFRGGANDPYKAQRAEIARRKALGLEPARRVFGYDIVNEAPGVFVVSKSGIEVGRAGDGRAAQDLAVAHRDGR
jgi:hypothetical protein